MRAGTRLPSAKLTNTWRARLSPCPFVTTCVLVAMNPSPSSTKPDPSPPFWVPSGPPPSPNSEMTVTTPGPSRS